MTKERGGDEDRCSSEPYRKLAFRLKFGNRSAKLEAIGQLGEFYPRRSVALLVNMLRNQDPDLRHAAVEALAKTGDAALESLWIALTDRRYRSEDVARALGRIGDPRSVGPLMSVLADPDLSNAEAVIEALAKIGGAAVKPLIDALQDERTPLRLRAARVLGTIRDPRVVAPLAAVLQDWEEEEEVRQAAETSLAAHGWRPGSPSEQAACALARRDWKSLAGLGDAAIPPLIAALLDSGGGERTEIIGVLGKIGDPRAIEPLAAVIRDIIKALHHRETTRLTPDMVRRVIATGNRGMLDMLKAEMEMESSGAMDMIRGDQDKKWKAEFHAAVKALRSIRDPRAVQALESLLADLDEKSGIHAADGDPPGDGTAAKDAMLESAPSQVEVVIFLQGELPNDHDPGSFDVDRAASAFARAVLHKKYDKRRVTLAGYRLIGRCEDVGVSDAVTVYGRMKDYHDLPELGQSKGLYEGPGPDGRPVVAVFFDVPAGQSASEAEAGYADHPTCGCCDKALEGGESIVSAGTAGVQDAEDYRLYIGAICFECRLALCRDCMEGKTEECPLCGGKTEPAYRKYLKALVSS